MNVLYISITGDDTLDLPVPLEVENFKCGVVEMTGKINNEFKGDIFLCSDVCEESIVGEIKLPVLRNIRRRPNGIVLNDINHITWLRVMRPRITSIRFYITNVNGEIITFEDNKLNCTLLFTPSI